MYKSLLESRRRKKEEVKSTLPLYGTSGFFRVASTSSLALHPLCVASARGHAAPGSRRVPKRKKKVYKIFKSTETSSIARGDKFPLTFYFRFAVFVRFATLCVAAAKRTGKKSERRVERRKTER